MEKLTIRLLILYLKKFFVRSHLYRDSRLQLKPDVYSDYLRNRYWYGYSERLPGTKVRIRGFFANGGIIKIFTWSINVKYSSFSAGDSGQHR